jgi:MoxR-like ATPase
MPADILGTNMIVEDESGQKYFDFQKGPIFAHILLADEINRATPKTQSALLEAMQEHSVTVAKTTYPLEEPFFVLATQNPLEMEGTYPLPEAQLDRFFFKLKVTFPGREALHEIMERTTRDETPRAEKVMPRARVLEMRDLVRRVPLAKTVQDYAIRVLQATHPETPEAVPTTKKFVRYGSSPRGAQALLLAAKIRALLDGRYAVAVDDIRKVAAPALRHRIILNFEGEAEGVQADAVVAEILEKTPETK